MKTLTGLKNLYATDNGFTDWQDLRESVQDDTEYEQHWHAVCVRAQEQALINAAENVMINVCDVFDWYSVDEKSITNKQNLVQ